MSESAESYNLSIILPSYNEELALPSVVSGIRSSLEKTEIKYEIILVDDGSTDKTAEVAKGLDLTIISNPQNMGTGYSRRQGILAAKSEIILFLDADGTYDTSDIPKMYNYFPEYDQVNGARVREVGSLALLRWPIKTLIRLAASNLSLYLIKDLNTGLKAMKKSLILDYLDELPQKFSSVTAMTIYFIGKGYKVKFFPTEYFERLGVSKFHPIGDTLRSIFVIIKTSFRVSKLGTILGFIELFCLIGISFSDSYSVNTKLVSVALYYILKIAAVMFFRRHR